MEQQLNEAVLEQQQPQSSGGKRLKKGGMGKPLAILGILAALVAAVYLGLCVFAGQQTVFYPNYTINGMHVGGLSAEEARELLAQDFPMQTVSFCDAEGGAVLTEEYAKDIGADAYGKDAMATVHYAQEVYGK